jgi:serine/threonine protein kinase
MSGAAPSQPAADRNLLFGILALQMDFISQDTLISSMNAWVLRKFEPIGQILMEQGALRGQDRELLEALLLRHLELHEQNVDKSLASLSSVGPVRRELERIADSDVQASLIHVRVHHDPEATREPSRVSMPSSGVRFRILRPHRRGGLGEVFVAEDQELHREVALKEIQDEHADDPESRGRFVREAEVTGGLEHPGIVPVYGLGTYADGRPYYAMRFIKGDSLHDAIQRFHEAEQSSRDPGSRMLELRKLLGRFLDVCNAIAYAHSRGVLHRDLKPGNIMLGPYGETLVVDWGLAKTLDQAQDQPDTTEAPLRPSGSGSAPTRMGQAVGTPAYMSPEQAAGRLDQLGPASDVYSLGATLYHLLTSRAPVSAGDMGVVLEKVQKGEFPPPRQVNPKVPRSLEAICLKAMALKREDRYASPRNVANDIERWLGDEPVSAYREPMRVRLSRWLRRHRPLVTGMAVLLVSTVVALSVGLVLLSQKQDEILQERNTARRAEARAKAINHFLRHDILAVARPEWLGKDVTVKKALDESARKIDRSFSEYPEVEADMRLTIGESYWWMGEYKEAEPQLRRALDLRTEHLGPNHRDTLTAVDRWAKLLQYQGKLAEAEPLFRENLENRRRNLGPEDVDTLTSLDSLGHLLLEQGKGKEAEPLLRECVDARRRVLSAEHADTLIAMNNLALAFNYQSKFVDAEKLDRETLDIRKRVLGPEHPDTLISRNNLACDLSSLDKLDDAVAWDRETLEIRRRVLGTDHRCTLLSMNNLAFSLQNQGKLADAEKLYREVVGIQQRVLGPDHIDTLNSTSNLATVISEQGKLEEARRLTQQVLQSQERSRDLGPEHPGTLLSMANLAIVLRDLGKLKEAADLYQKALTIQRRISGAEHSQTLWVMTQLAYVLDRQGKFDEAECLFRDCLKVRLRDLGPGDGATRTVVMDLADLLEGRKKYLEAETLVRENWEACRRKLGETNADTLWSWNNWATWLHDTGRRPEAEVIRREILAIRKRDLGSEHRDTLIAMSHLAATLSDQGKYAESEPLLRQILDVRRLERGPEHRDTLWAMTGLAGLLQDQGKGDAAEPLFREVLKVRRRDLGETHGNTLHAMEELASCLEDRGRQAEAETLLREALAARRKTVPPEDRVVGRTLIALGRVVLNKGAAKEAETLLREALDQNALSRVPWRFAYCRNLLGGCLTAQSKYKEAEELLLGEHEHLKAAPVRRLREALGRIVKLYEAWNRPEEARKWRAINDELVSPAVPKK